MSAVNYTSNEAVTHILSRLDSVRSSGPGKWVARCPAHQDKSPSLSIREADNGGALIFCFAGCAAADIVAAVGLEMKDLFPEQPPDGKHSYRSKAPRIDSSDAINALKDDLLALAIAFNDIASGRDLSADDMRYVSQHALHITEVLSEVQASG